MASAAFASKAAIRRGVERDGPDALARVEEVHLRDVVLAVAHDRIDGLDEGVKRRYVGDRDGKVPKRRFVDGGLHEVCHGVSLHCGTTLSVVPVRKMLRISRGLHAPGNMTDNYRVGGGGD